MQPAAMLETLPDPFLITTHPELVRLVAELSHQPILAVDTESNGLHAYREQVCLVQFSTPEADYLIDPLAIDDLSPLGPLFADHHIEKVFHAAEYDVFCLQRDYGFTFANLFDTMLAARILGRPVLGLGPLLQSEFGVRLDKRHQRADWGKRPLSAALLSYARLDTHYLVRLRHLMHQELLETQRWALAQEDFQRLCSFPERVEPEDPDALPHINGAHELTPQQYAVLLQLCAYRDEVARLRDRPLFKVINNETLLTIARHCPGRLAELNDIPGMTPRQIQRHGRRLLTAVRRGLQAEPVQLPRPARPNEIYLNRLDRLRNWRKQAAQAMGVESDIVLPKDLMHSIAERNPTRLADLGELLHETPWRFQHFGGQIMQALPPASHRKNHP